MGVVQLLNDINLLSRVTDVYSVSGGSILAGQLVLRWSDYFESDAIANLHRFADADIRGRIVRRWILFRWLTSRFGRTEQLQGHYSRLFDGAEMQAVSACRPRLHILATSMTTGRLCSFTPEGFWDGLRFRRAPSIPIAQAVAASSAFPPLFPPLMLSRKELRTKAQFPVVEYLTDGGVVDNVGITEVPSIKDFSSVILGQGGLSSRDTPKKERQDPFDVVIVSDASASFDQASETSRWNLLARSIRTSDILMHHVASLDTARANGRLYLLPISIEDTVTASDFGEGTDDKAPLDYDVQKLVSMIRTDFNRFSQNERTALVCHGYEVALKRVCQLLRNKTQRQLGLERFTDLVDQYLREEATKWSLPPALFGKEGFSQRKPQPLRRELEQSSHVPAGLWDPRDWTSWLLLALALGPISVIGWFYPRAMIGILAIVALAFLFQWSGGHRPR